MHDLASDANAGGVTIVEIVNPHNTDTIGARLVIVDPDTAQRRSTVAPNPRLLMRSARRMADFLDLHVQDPTIRERFTLRHGRDLIAWDDFVFGPDEQSLQDLRRRVTGRGIRHPVFVRCVSADPSKVNQRGGQTVRVRAAAVSGGSWPHAVGRFHYPLHAPALTAWGIRIDALVFRPDSFNGDLSLGIADAAHLHIHR
ncbi:hypothetical protein HQQ81_21055 [Microbacteriaceae bacterium VKM Ac-2854]|nr:hypothetical protein [Microbacteriaceae bacterium VKM Ac-2854]